MAENGAWAYEVRRQGESCRLSPHKLDFKIGGRPDQGLDVIGKDEGEALGGEKAGLSRVGHGGRVHSTKGQRLEGKFWRSLGCAESSKRLRWGAAALRNDAA